MDPISQTNPGVPDRIARYRVDEKLVGDAYGTVFAAVDENERAKVRLRLLPRAVDVEPSRRARIAADARAAMQVDHPGIAAVLDVGEGAEGLFVVSDPAPRRTLRAYLEERGPLDLAEALRLAQEIASAVGAAHRLGVVHGILSDERVVIADDGRAKVVDLGLAELARASAKRPVDARTDVYAIAAMLHEMITGTRVGTSEVSSDPPERLPPLDAAAPGVPARLATLIERATSPDPTDSPADADLLLAALTEIDLPALPIPQQAAESRAAVVAGSSKLWITGVSVAIALVIAVGVLLALAR